MRKALLFIFLVIANKTIAQNTSKTAFQKSRYELAVSCYEKSDYKKALELFHVAYKMKPDTKIGEESIKKIDTIKTVLRKNALNQVLGTWKMAGDKPIWAVSQTQNNPKKDFDELVEITQNEILFYERNKKTQEKKMVKSEDLVYYNKDESDALFSDIILSDGTIWNCSVNENADELRAINVGKKDENGVIKIENDNDEIYYVKVK